MDVPANTTTPWMRVDQAAAYALVSEKTLYRAVESGKLRCARVGGRRSLRFKREFLDQWLVSTVIPVVAAR